MLTGAAVSRYEKHAVCFVPGLPIMVPGILTLALSRAAGPLPPSLPILHRADADSAGKAGTWSSCTISWPRRAALLALALLIVVTIDARAADPRRVLLLHAFGHPYSPWSDMAGSFHAELIKESRELGEVEEVAAGAARVRRAQDETSERDAM